MHIIPDQLLDLRQDSEIDDDFLHFRPVSDEKNIWFFWGTGYKHMHQYTKRNVRAWHRRFSKQGWTIRITDRVPGSPLNIAHFLDLNDPNLFPRAFAEDSLNGINAPQHTSDLVRWPLLLKHGGVYADVGLIQIGDLESLWNQTIGDPASRFKVIGYGTDSSTLREVCNYFFASGRDNPFFARCHRLYLELWAADGGRTNQKGMHSSPLLKGIPLVGAEYDSSKDVQMSMSDYMIQGLVTMMVMGLVDEEGGWNGPDYVAEHVYVIDYRVGCALYNEMTDGNGTRQFELMSSRLPTDGDAETSEQKQAAKIVETSLQRSFGLKLIQGLLVDVAGDTLGSLWRKHEGSDNIPGTYAHWLRHGSMYWNQDHNLPPLEFNLIEPIKRGQLLKAN